MGIVVEQRTEWDVDVVDVDRYLARVGLPRSEPSAAALRSLHAAHVRAIPFENVDVVLGRHRGISLPVVFDKLVGRKRGGYCYEHALLFAAVLERLGYRVRRSYARVQPDHPGPETHMMLVVEVDGVEHLVDVGFGAQVMYPMPLVHGAEVDQAGWLHRIVREDDLWTLQKRVDGGWERLHSTAARPARPVDYEVFHHYTSTHPRSPFTGRLVVMRLGDGVSRKLVGHELVVEHADGRVEQRPVGVDELDEVLRGLDIELDEEESALLRERYTAE